MDVREKLVELLTEFYGCDPMYYGVDALAVAQHLIAHGVTVQEWIPVTERLPETMQPVIVCRKGGKVEQGYKDVGDWWKVYGTRTKHVTYWMPLPKGE